jgi:hypothetical protein
VIDEDILQMARKYAEIDPVNFGDIDKGNELHDCHLLAKALLELYEASKNEP